LGECCFRGGFFLELESSAFGSVVS
jgi:hypothetical protein